MLMGMSKQPLLQMQQLSMYLHTQFFPQVSELSLVELMIVLAIISTLTIIVLVAGGKMFSSKQEIITDTAIAIPSAGSVCAKLHRGQSFRVKNIVFWRRVFKIASK
jgi:fatty-acid desaturase